MPIYTKAGDSGKTSLYGGSITTKAAKVFEVLGSLDELSSSLGLLSLCKNSELKKTALFLQTDLIKIGSLLAGKKITKPDTLALETSVKKIELSINKMEKAMNPLKSFILPGGKQEAVYLHLARAIARRLERNYISYTIVPNSIKTPVIERYLNRLSDYLFVLARYYNNKGKNDTVCKGI